MAARRSARNFDDGVGSNFARLRANAPILDLRDHLLEQFAGQRHDLIRSVSLRAKLPVNRLGQDGDSAGFVSGRSNVGRQGHDLFRVRQGAEPSGCVYRKQAGCRHFPACAFGHLAANRRAFDTQVRRHLRDWLRRRSPPSVGVIPTHPAKAPSVEPTKGCATARATRLRRHRGLACRRPAPPMARGSTERLACDRCHDARRTALSSSTFGQARFGRLGARTRRWRDHSNAGIAVDARHHRATG